MDCRERVLAALNLEEPDRVPCHAILIDANNVDTILLEFTHVTMFVS